MTTVKEYMELFDPAFKGLPICLILTPNDFRRGYDMDISGLRTTREDVMMADKVIVMEHRKDPDAPVTLHVLKERNDKCHEYKLITRPENLSYE
jgi:hypothetical protein